MPGSSLLDGAVNAARRLVRKDGDRGHAQRMAILAFLIRVASAGIAYLLQIALARWMGSFEYGIFVFVWVWVLILGGVAPLGLNTSVIRFIPEYMETRNFALLRGLLADARAITVWIATAIMLAGMAGLYFFSDWIESYYVLPFYLALICVPLYALCEIQDGMGRGYAWMDVALLPPFVLRPLFILAAMGLAYLMSLPMTATTAAGAAIIACWAAAVIQSAMLERRLARHVAKGKKAHQQAMWLAVSVPLLLVLSFELLLQNTDVLVLSLFRNPTDVAIYYAALKTIALMNFVHFAVSAAVANRFSAYKAQGDPDRLSAFVRDAVRWTFWPTLAAAVVLLALGKPLLWLFGPGFTAAYPVMFVLAVGFLFRSAMGPAEFVLNMLGEHRLCAAILSVSAVINLALNFALIPLFGLMGAAAATALAVATATLLLGWAAKRRLGLNLFVGRLHAS